LRVHAIGVNPVDTYILAGKHYKAQLPYTPGKDAAGHIEIVGPGVTEFQPGDRVYASNAISGTYAQRALCAVSMVHPLPEKSSFAHGATLGIAAGVAYFALFLRSAAKAGETVLIHGATGGVGLAAVQLGRAAGMTIFATAGDDRGCKFLLDQGAHQAFHHNITEDPVRLKSLTAGRGIDVIIENAADKNLASDLGALSDRGRVAVVGSRAPIQIDPRQTMQRNADIRGVTLERTTPDEHRAIYAALTAALEAGTLRPVIAMELPLDQAVRSHHEVMSRHPPGKIILRPPGSKE
jgi:NADPH2:quinone reductase